jgi:hypothetical protein
LIVIDSSEDTSSVKNFLKKNNFNFKVLYFWMSPCGIYPAMNRGIVKSSNTYIQIINSGDLLLSSSRKIISHELEANPNVNIFIFDQLSGYGDGPSIQFSPTNNSLWPHQSIIVKKKVHDELGLYSEKFELISDQIFFIEAKMLFSFKIINKSLTYYDLTGASSKLNRKMLVETFILWRKFGKSITYSMLKSTSLIFKVVLLKFFGRNAIIYIRTFIFSHYSKK